MLTMPPDQLIARIRELLAQPKPTATAMLEIEKLLPEVLETLERYKRERDHYQGHREELMEMAQKRCADEIEQLKNARVPTETRCPQCNTLHVDQDEWAHEIAHRKHLCHGCGYIWQPHNVATVGVDFHVTCRERHDRLEADIAWMRSAWGEAEEDNKKLRERRDQLLELVAKLSQTVPLESEVADALRQRGVLLAEIGTLRASLAEYEPLFTLVGALRKALLGVCDIATTPLPEDRERVIAARALANKVPLL